MRFWRGQERENSNKDQHGALLCGQVRVLVVGDSGVGKTSIVNLITKGSSISRPSPTIGCAVNVKHVTYGSPTSSSNSIKGDAERDFFVELMDISGHDRYKDCRSIFYSQINGVIFVYDLSQKRTKTSLKKWAEEIAATGTFSAPMGSGGPTGLPVPFIVISNKADVASKEGVRGSTGNLVDVARHWVEKQGLLPPSEELPLTESFPGNETLLAAAKEARFDKEAVTKFFKMLIRKRYFPDELPPSSSWSTYQIGRYFSSSDDMKSTENQFGNLTSLSGEAYDKYNALPPLPAQHGLPPPPTLYPQRPMLTPEANNVPRYSLSSASELSYTRPKRTDINV